MKRIAFACALAFAATCHAGGPFDGLYKHPLKPDAYLSGPPEWRARLDGLV